MPKLNRDASTNYSRNHGAKIVRGKIPSYHLDCVVRLVLNASTELEKRAGAALAWLDHVASSEEVPIVVDEVAFISVRSMHGQNFEASGNGGFGVAERSGYGIPGVPSGGATNAEDG